MLRIPTLATLLGLAACAGTGPASQTELTPPDALPTTGETYVISQLRLPRGPADAAAGPFDFDGDGVADNSMGVSLSAVADYLDVDLATRCDEAIASGESLHLLALHRDETGAHLDTARLFLGADTDGDPKNNMAGGPLAVRDGAPLGDAAFGVVGDDFVSVGAGRLTVENVLFAPVAVTLADARIEAERDGETLTGSIGGLIPASEARFHIGLVAAFAISAEIEASCDAGAVPRCPEGSRAATYLTVFDADDSGSVSVDEVLSNDLFQYLLSPDIDRDGDGEPDAKSFGFEFTAVPASFEIPAAPAMGY